MFAVGLSYMAFIMLRYVLSIHAFWMVFIINGCWILSKAFSASIEIIICFMSFSLLMWCITLIDLQILKNPCIPGINPTWSWCMIFLICCWILFAKILLKIYIHQWYWPIVFFFVWHIDDTIFLLEFLGFVFLLLSLFTPAPFGGTSTFFQEVIFVTLALFPGH